MYTYLHRYTQIRNREGTMCPPRPNRVKHFEDVMFPTISINHCRLHQKVQVALHSLSTELLVTVEAYLLIRLWMDNREESVKVNFRHWLNFPKLGSNSICFNPLKSIICDGDASYIQSRVGPQLLFSKAHVYDTPWSFASAQTNIQVNHICLLPIRGLWISPKFLHFIFQERRSYIMDAMRIAEQRKEVCVFWKTFLSFCIEWWCFPQGHC